MVPATLLLDAAITPLEVAAAMSATVMSPAREFRARMRLHGAGLHGCARWLAHAGDRRWVSGRFALPLSDTPYARRVRSVGLRHYALTQRCMAVEADDDLRDAVALIGDPAALPERTIITFLHSPAMWFCLYALSHAGVRFFPIATDWFWDDPMAEVRTATVAENGGRIIPATGGGFEDALALLREGGKLGLAADVPGSTPVRFFDKPARVRSGIARLALATDASVVPIHGTFRRGRPVAVLGAPIAPRGDVETLMGEIIAAVEAPLAGRPEAWMPYTGDLWPDRVGAHREAYAEDAPHPEVGSVA